jgi:glycosyl transferase family 87
LSGPAVTSWSPRVRRDEFGTAAQQVLFGVIPIVATFALLAFELKVQPIAVDFRSAYFPAAVRLLNGGSPYAGITHHEVLEGYAFVYPALAAIAFGPFAVISRIAGQLLYTAICIACVPATLRVLNVRDWRVYGITLLWFPVYTGWLSANLTLPLMFMTAVAWRYRDRPLIAGLVTVAAISLKPFIWPLGLWLLATRRWRAAAYALVCGLALNLVAWAVVGFNEIHTYLQVSGKVTDALWRSGYSMLAIAQHLGFGRGAADVLLLVVAAAVSLAVIYVGFFRRQEREAMVLAILLMLVASPLVWSHYFALLLVPLALTRPRLSAVWAAPILIWVCPPRTGVAGWQEVLVWIVACTCLLWPPRARESVQPATVAARAPA